MADITMCRGENCEKRENCYRYTAPINKYRQSVFARTPEKKPCPYYWNNDGMLNGKEIGEWWKGSDSLG